MNIVRKYLTWTILGLAATGCSNHEFLLGGAESSFTQSSKTLSVPIDVLWVVDNSGSMKTSQDAVAANVASFIAKFKETNFDFQIAVTTTQAYKSMTMFTGNPTWSRFVDGTDATSHTGVFIIDNDTPNMEQVFQTNIMQGITGSGDERGFQSIEATLSNSDNLAQFPRPGAYLAIIALTDEEDYSWEGTANIQNTSGAPTPITDPRLNPISKTTDFLDALTKSTADKKNYVVNTIAIFDQPCLDQLSPDFAGRMIANRYAALTDATGGIKASLCGNFDNILQGITDSILIQTTKFYIDREPVVSSIVVYVDGVAIDSSAWTYEEDENAVSFHADSIPPKNASVRVAYQPAELI